MIHLHLLIGTKRDGCLNGLDNKQNPSVCKTKFYVIYPNNVRFTQSGP